MYKRNSSDPTCSLAVVMPFSQEIELFFVLHPHMTRDVKAWGAVKQSTNWIAVVLEIATTLRYCTHQIGIKLSVTQRRVSEKGIP